MDSKSRAKMAAIAGMFALADGTIPGIPLGGPKPKRDGTHCIQCDAKIPPGRPRKCKDCRKK